MTIHSRPVTGILKGSSIFFIASLITYAIRFATSVIIARTLGPGGKGIYVLVITLGAFLVLFFNFGLNSAITYLTASKSFREKDLFAFAVVAALLWGLIGILVFYPLYNFVLYKTLLVGVSQNYIYLVLALLPANLLISFLISILLGQQYILQYNLVELCRIFANLLLQIISAVLGWGLTGAILAWVISNILALLFALWFTRDNMNIRINHIREIIKPAFSYGARSYVANLFSFFNYRLDSFLVNFFSGAVAVGLYSTGVSVAELLYYVPNAISGALFPKIPRLSPGTASLLTARLCRIVLIVTIPICVIFGVAGIFIIPRIFGVDFKPSVLPFLLLLPGILGISLSKLIAADLSGRGKPQYSMNISIITVILTIFLDVILIPKANISGAAIASTIAYLTSAILYVFWFCIETHTPWMIVIIPNLDDFRLIYRRGTEIAHLAILSASKYFNYSK